MGFTQSPFNNTLSFGHIHLLPILFPPLHAPVSLIIFLHTFLKGLVPLGQLHLLYSILPPLHFSLGFTQSPFNNTLSFGQSQSPLIFILPLAHFFFLDFLHSSPINSVPLGQEQLLY